MNSVRSNSLKNQRITPSGRKDIRIRRFEFEARIHFLYNSILHIISTMLLFSNLYFLELLGKPRDLDVRIEGDNLQYFQLM